MMTWLAAAAAGAAYGLLLLTAHRPAAVRCGRLGAALLLFWALRAALALAAGPLRAPLDAALLAGAWLPGAALLVARRLWLIRAAPGGTIAADAVGGRVREGCRRLLLPYEESVPGRFNLMEAAGASFLRVRPLGPALAAVILPATHHRPKSALLVAWLAKEFPEPIPRPRIVLKRSSP